MIWLEIMLIKQNRTYLYFISRVFSRNTEVQKSTEKLINQLHKDLHDCSIYPEFQI
jgi:hypothetical protein